MTTRKGIFFGTFFALLVGATFAENVSEDQAQGDPGSTPHRVQNPLKLSNDSYPIDEGDKQAPEDQAQGFPTSTPQSVPNPVKFPTDSYSIDEGNEGTPPTSAPQMTRIATTATTQEFNGWANPSVTSDIKFYIYNVTNADEFLNNGSKPIVDEIGPYVYKEKWTRKDITFNENGTVSYYLEKHYYFNEDLSAGKEADLVTVPNIPMLAATSQSQYASTYLRIAISSIMDILKLNPFVKVSVKQLLWGYKDLLLELAKEVVPKEQKVPYEEFGLMVNKNGTQNDRVTVFTKANGVTQNGLIDTVNGMTHQKYWLTDKCNSFLASDGSYFPPHIQKNETLHLYEKDLCRTLPLVFEQEGNRNDNVTSWRFSPPKNVFDSVEKNPENQCYCPDGPPCAPSGLFNVTLCQYDTPLMLSFPHFYLADDTLRTAVDGISPPDPEKHKFYLDVQPDFGFAMSTKRRLQFNLAVSHVNGIPQVATFPDFLFPIMWFEETVELNPEDITKLMKNKPEDESQALKWWAKPPVVPVTKFYIYNVTNVNKFLDNGSKPIVDEVGPYVYEEQWERKNITFNENGTVSYYLEKHYYFNKNLSAGLEDDLVIVPNIPLLSTTSQCKHGTRFLRLAIASITDILKIKPFIVVSVGQLLWGYEDPFLAEDNNVLPVKPKYPFDEFGLMYNKNGTRTDRVSVFTGTNDKTKYGLIDTINGMTHQTHWLTKKCNSLLASDGFFFPPHTTKDTILRVYDNDLCRTLPLEFEQEVNRTDNVTSWRFSPPKNVFDSVEKNPENQCYCRGGSSCAPSGLFNVSLCQYDWPMMVSFPHFYLADDALRTALDGISPPDPEKHKYHFDVHPEMGFTISSKRRLQINLAVSHEEDIKLVATFPDIIFPILWFEESVRVYIN